MKFNKTMLIGPRKLKYKKVQKGKLKKLEFKTNRLTFGTYGLKALESGFINISQIESARQNIARKIKRKGKIWIKIFPDVPISCKSTNARMGKGKGAFCCWAARIAKGTIIFEICGVNFNIIFLALKAGGAKLPIKTKICN